MRPWAALSVGWQPCPWQGGRNSIFKVMSNLSYSRILWDTYFKGCFNTLHKTCYEGCSSTDHIKMQSRPYLLAVTSCWYQGDTCLFCSKITLLFFTGFTFMSQQILQNSRYSPLLKHLIQIWMLVYSLPKVDFIPVEKDFCSYQMIGLLS